MFTRKSSPKIQTKNGKGMLTEKSKSFHGRASEGKLGNVGKLTRPRTVPDLISGKSVVMTETTGPPKLTKLLINVTVVRSLGPVHVLISPELTVGDLITAALQQYGKEGRRPILPSVDGSRFDLHYSQFSLESLAPDSKLIDLGSRNFFLCPKQAATAGGNGGGYGGTDGGVMVAASSCSKEAGNVTKGAAVWHRLMEFML